MTTGLRIPDFLVLPDLDADLTIVPASEAIAAGDVIGPTDDSKTSPDISRHSEADQFF